ncbi:hypothetical protein F2Q70_00040619 [Brassica cretica]|uniref:RPW8 domain-containing protein n=1 Tax=Brassica cretica TaxID=69181 RepID=A0A8S9K1N2_BRACR|nr:hypothetical protein F2Q70_00040619 [Brassica cretica]
MPIGEVMVGAALGITLQVLHEAIMKAKDRSLTTKYILERLEATISRITPLVAISLVEAYAELRRRNLLKKYRYKSRIKELEASLRWMVEVD